jgi:hypothetical protein
VRADRRALERHPVVASQPPLALRCPECTESGQEREAAGPDLAGAGVSAASRCCTGVEHSSHRHWSCGSRRREPARSIPDAARLRDRQRRRKRQKPLPPSRPAEVSQTACQRMRSPAVADRRREAWRDDGDRQA